MLLYMVKLMRSFSIFVKTVIPPSNIPPKLPEISEVDESILEESDFSFFPVESKSSKGEVDFMVDDLNSIGSIYSLPARTLLYLKVEPCYYKLPDIKTYWDTLNNLYKGINRFPKDLMEPMPDFLAKEVFPLGHSNLTDAIRDSRVLTDLAFSKSESFISAAKLLSYQMKSLSGPDRNILSVYSEKYEWFTLLTLEPYIIGIIGGSTFIDIFPALHRKGKFSYFMSKVLTFEELPSGALYYMDFFYRISTALDIFNYSYIPFFSAGLA
jgi:hypothetical protein